jgi:hypothetical protein
MHRSLSILVVPALLFVSSCLAFTVVGTDVAIAADCGDGVGPCSCGDRVITNTTLSAADPVRTTICPCNGLVVASGVTLKVRGTIRSNGPSASCNISDIPNAGIVIETGSSNVVIMNGHLVGFEVGVFGRSITDSRISHMHIVNGGIVVGTPGPDGDVSTHSHRNIVQYNVVEGVTGFGISGLGITIIGDENKSCHNRVEDCRDGIHEGGARNIVCSNAVICAPGGGQGLTNAGNNSVFASNLVQSCGNGVIVGGSGGAFTGNVSLGNDGVGFTVLQTGNTFRYNAAIRNGFWGFLDASGDPADNVYEHNWCFGNVLDDSIPDGLCRSF